MNIAQYNSKNTIKKFSIFISITSLMVGLILIGMTYDENRDYRRVSGTIVGMTEDSDGMEMWEVEFFNNDRNRTELGHLRVSFNENKQIGDKVTVYHHVFSHSSFLPDPLSNNLDFFPIQGILISLTLAFLFSIRSGMTKCLSKMFFMRKRFAFLWLALNAILLIMSVYHVTGIEDYVYKMLSGIVLFGVNTILLIALLIRTPS